MSTACKRFGGASKVGEDVEHLLSLGALALEPLSEVGEGLKVAAVQDLFGNRIGLIENPNSEPSGLR